MMWPPLVCGLVLNVAAQPAPPLVPSAPAQVHERLGFFEGAWTILQATPEDDFQERCAWLPEGRRHMVCRSRWKTPSGHREGMSVFSYDERNRQYVYTGFRAGGAVVVLTGHEQDGRWRFGSDEGTGASRVRMRVTIEPTPDRGFVLRSERATGEGAWTPASEVTYRRLLP